ncbi:hypothetical protein BX600DRAFT_467323 [Xylariales sp. PMI_506]|nr:hypothetical protein BX600DRAFT_467323 [Xylariales sp. PMI_506]
MLFQMTTETSPDIARRRGMSTYGKERVQMSHMKLIKVLLRLTARPLSFSSTFAAVAGIVVYAIQVSSVYALALNEHMTSKQHVIATVGNIMLFVAGKDVLGIIVFGNQN